METLLKAISNATKSPNDGVRLFIIGVFVPGFLLSVECVISYIAIYWSNVLTLEHLTILTDESKSFVLIVMMVTLTISVACVVGYLNREIAFIISNIWIKSRFRPTVSYDDIIDLMYLSYGVKKVADTIEKHEIFKLPGKPESAKLPRIPEFYIREYCKLWLSIERPTLNTNGFETEINIMIALVAPTVFCFIPIILISQNTIGDIFAFFAIFIGISLFYRINVHRGLETEHVIRRFLFAHWYNIETSSLMEGISEEDE